MVSFSFLYLAYAFAKDPAFYFLTPTTLESIIIYDQETSLVLYHRNFSQNLPSEGLIGSIFSALNISLKSVLKHPQDLKSVSFGDKEVIMSSGKFVTSLFLVNRKSLVAIYLSRYVAKTFEKHFILQLKLIRRNGFVQKEMFRAFDKVVSKVRQYLPL